MAGGTLEKFVLAKGTLENLLLRGAPGGGHIGEVCICERAHGGVHNGEICSCEGHVAGGTIEKFAFARAHSGGHNGEICLREGHTARGTMEKFALMRGT